MKRFLSMFLVSAVIGLVAVPADATLIDRGGGLIYDDDLNITWLQDANYASTSGYDADGAMEWPDAVTWADTLVYGGYSDWRLPTLYDGSADSTDFGYNITSSEMGHLFYTELGNNSSLTNTGPFTNLQVVTSYWSGTEYALNPDLVWWFSFNDGYQRANHGVGNSMYVWAVRSGDSAAASVPEPSTLLLLAAGFGGLLATRKRLLNRKS